MTKPFEQYCPVAHALGLVGDRWALLILRDLLHGQKRYTDLLEGLPGIGTNILAGRLHDLEEAGIVAKRKLPPPAASTVYELTDYGRELEEVFDELYPEWGVNAFAALFMHEAARGLTETYVLKIDGDVFSVQLEDGRMHASVGAVEDADVTIEIDMPMLFRLAGGELSPREALKTGLASIEGDKAAFERCFQVLTLAPRTLAAA